MAICTDAERELLDAMWDNVKKYDAYECPYCGYGATGPATKDIHRAMARVVEEGAVFTDEQANKFVHCFGRQED